VEWDVDATLAFSYYANDLTAQLMLHKLHLADTVQQ
jgi:hypothetical protein